LDACFLEAPDGGDAQLRYNGGVVVKGAPKHDVGGTLNIKIKARCAIYGDADVLQLLADGGVVCLTRPEGFGWICIVKLAKVMRCRGARVEGAKSVNIPPLSICQNREVGATREGFEAVGEFLGLGDCFQTLLKKKNPKRRVLT
jgi:hypothetical protein